jgi:outer membrane biosynthesis protein TonB
MNAASSNGFARSSRPPPPLGVVVAARDPMNAVIDLDKKKAGLSTGIVLSTIAQILFVLGIGFITSWGLMSWTQRVQAEIRARLRADYEIEIKEEQPPPEPEKEPEPTPQPVQAVQQVHNNNAPPPPAAPAAAAPALTANPDDVVDLTNTIVTGDGGGGGAVQMNNGTGSGAATAVATGVPGGTGAPSAAPAPVAPPPAPTVDKSRAAREVSGNWRWCPFPAEADMAQIDEARVTMEVTLRADGTPERARVLADPGNGFGAQARSCAMRAKYTGALDRDGNPIPTTFRFNVTFSR